MRDKIAIQGMPVDCVVGIYPSERPVPQRLLLDLTLHLDTRPAAMAASIRDTVDYARLSAEVRFLLESCHFELLETAVEALAAYVLAPPTEDGRRCPVNQVSIRVVKPSAFEGRGTPSVEIQRTAGDFSYRREVKPFGEVDVIFETPKAGIYRLRIAPGKAIPTHVHRRMEESELVLGEGLLLQRKPVAPGTVLRWPRELPHRYDNPTAIEQTVLCVDRPAFSPDDEVEVPEPAEGLPAAPATRYYPEEDLLR